MGGAVLAHNAGAVYAESHRQAQQSHVVYHMVIGSLQKRAVDCHKRVHAVFGESAGKCHGMSFGNAHVKHSVGHFALKGRYGCAVGHGCRYSHNPGIPARKLQQGVAEHVLPFRGVGAA